MLDLKYQYLYLLRQIYIDLIDLDKAMIFKKLEEDKSNKMISLKELTIIYHNFDINLQGSYFPYNLQIQDRGWGCAWRAIQTLLSTQQILFSFQDLYNKFSSKTSLLNIVKEKLLYSPQIINQLSQIQWAPAEIKGNWAQPFIAYLVCKSFNLPYQVLLLNGHPKSYAPYPVFKKIIVFSQFIILIKQVIKYSSVMIDDGLFALSIIGIKHIQQDRIQLLFADPHIKSNQKQTSAGLYRKIYNKNGKGIQNCLSQQQIDESLYNVYDQLQFEDKHWMICTLDIQVSSK